ncbi:UDP-N-acetyl-D-glucosamine dehydrogenase [Deinococcus metalli]|uniref:UDP-N-acetyl-D-glucosamine dehydrogenase n=1 Tax=Deinococcus metalli TaxID=1141878 RepID=A0A7W8KEE1_9DEIO|nr:nucleotide sugar dehydrogenase [Deinococcus metalli]MBB5376645.1 UDP-N-acetyl-D-glucosamine dehydrogenase [Deinococcus metalli]GHF42547.1 UDP-N-acetyl-D-glucosamine dehydrogenase [Deinococcus metalli]
MTLTTTAAALDVKLAQRTARIAVLGLGYVGTPLAVHLARSGFAVTGFDPQARKVDEINAGRSPVQDVAHTDVAELLGLDTLRATSRGADLAGHDVYILCVPTPLDESKQPDMKYIERAASLVAEHVRPGTLVVLESTTYPGTTDEMLVPMLAQGGLIPDEDLFVAFSPERVDPGNAKFNTGNIPKLVGGIGPRSTELATALYRAFLPSVHPVSSARVAEMAKLHENTFRAVNIGYANELAMICQALGVNVWEVVDAAATKPFGFMPFYPGPGIGGHCIPLDPHYLAWRARKEGFATRFIDLADQVNSGMPRYIVGRLMNVLNARAKALRGSHVLVLGVTYKPDVDDARESPAMDVIRELERHGAQVRYVDPYVEELPHHHGPHLQAVRAELDDETCAWTDVAVILTHHSCFDFNALSLRVPQIFDTRGAARHAPGAVELL